MADEVPQRAELMWPYRHPVRLAGRATWKTSSEVRFTTFLGGAATAVGVAGYLAGAMLLMILGVAGVFGLLAAAFMWVYLTSIESVQLIRAWRQKSELRDVLDRRPQAGSEDPDLVHDLYAVTVQDDGWLYTWRYRPLHWYQDADEDEVEVPGRPRYEARVIDERRFDARDAARAAEQLVEAQEGAAKREALAAARAAHVVEQAGLNEHELEEARTTAAALQRSTGQRSRRS